MTPKATTFHFLDYTFDEKSLEIAFNYRISFSNMGPMDFTETITLPKAPNTLSKEALDKLLQPVSLIIGISYFKLYLPRKIETSFDLSIEQTEFWHTVYRKGLGELLYRNGLDPKRIPKFPSKKTKSDAVQFEVNNRSLLGIGGGKESVVASELLRDENVTSFLVETQKSDPISEQVIKAIGNPSLTVHRTLDAKIFDEHEGSFNGHIPISAVFAFLGLMSAGLYGYKQIIVGNEHSSNIGNLKYKGEEINHQWSKSAEFETLAQEYTRKFISPDITYFSVLRQFFELRIAEIFAEHKKYFPIFSSCNRNFRVFEGRPETLWCCECPKCVFVFLMLAPFLPKQELIDIFGMNMFADEKLIPIYSDLLGFGNLKPLDCVGTFEESRVALFLAAKKFKNDVVVKELLPKIKDGKELSEMVFKTVPAPTLPTPYRFLGIKNVAILGYGKEGMITESYLRKTFPQLELASLDQKRDQNYLDKQKNFDLVIKTPGISKTKVTVPYTTATNIFFSQIPNFTIGVTGSKGKSTTASLIHDMLKAGGKKVRLIGNIGKPMLEVLLTKPDPKEIYVIELSSYMLDDIEYSPNIALLVNLFPDHLDYHGGVEKYYAAKRRIFEFQTGDDVAFEPPHTGKIPTKTADIPLLGKHNQTNIKAAMRVARELGVSDKAIDKAIKNFKPLPHRLEFIGEFNGISFYDDAISTTPESTIMAIKSLPKIGTIFLGGEDRGYDFKELERVIRAEKIENIVLFPNSGKRILKSRKGLNVLETTEMKKAIQFAHEHTAEGEICLLSTASPSYSVWKNFEEKGDLFQKFAKQLAK